MTCLAYLTMVFVLRISGKRTLSKMNAFDFVVTVALGSTLATVMLNTKITLSEGAAAFFVLIFMQYIITWLSVRIKPLKKIITSQPRMLLYKGELMEDVIKKERITMEELYQAAREHKVSDLKEIDAMILETTGEITIMRGIRDMNIQSMDDVIKADKHL